jgi:hypothetical protein
MSSPMEIALGAISLAWRHREGSPFVEAYSPALKGWAIVAEGKDTAELLAHDVAALIASAVNGNREDEELIEELAAALQACLGYDGRLDFSAEMDADQALRKAGQRRRQ